MDAVDAWCVAINFQRPLLIYTFRSATGFELVLFGFVLYKGVRSYTVKAPFPERPTLVEVLIGDNILYFLG